jgi:protein O-mannosyl-transferase
MTSQQKNIFYYLLLLLISILVYSNVIKLGFVNWDDGKYVYENSDISQLNIQSTGKFFTTPVVGMYQPIPMISYAIEYHFFQNNPLVYHLTNLFFHLLNILLLFILIRMLTKNMFIAFFTALIFAMHPLHVESVAWISERKDVMFVFFYFLSLIFYLKYLDKESRIRYLWISLLLFLFSLWSKSAAVTLPVILLLIDYYRSVPLSKRTILQKLPFLVLSLIFGIVSIYTQQVIKHDQVPLADFTFMDKIFLATGSFTYYVYSFFVPVDLSAFHPFPIKTGDFLPVRFYFSIVVPVVFIVGLTILYKSKRIAGILKKELLFGLIFFLITLFLFIYIAVGSALVSERYTYLPYIGLGMALIIVINWIMERFNSSGILKASVWVILLCYTGFYAVASYNRVAVWKDSITLWSDAVKKDPSIIGYYNLGNAYRETKNYAEALKTFHHALDIDQNYADAWNNIGVTYADLKNYNEALPAFEKAHSLKPDDVLTLLNRANNYKACGLTDKAMSDYNQLSRIDSSNAEVFFQRGTLNLASGNLIKAVVDISKAIALNPDYAEAYNNRGYIRYLSGNLKDAEKDILKAIEIKPEYIEAYLNLSSVMEAQNDLKSALIYIEKAISLNHDYSAAYFNRSVLYSRLNNLTDALNDLDKAIKLDPTSYKAYNNRAEIKIRLNDLKGALVDLDQMLLLKPDYSYGYYSRAIIKKQVGLNNEACADMQKAQQMGVALAGVWLKNNCR